MTVPHLTDRAWTTGWTRPSTHSGDAADVAEVCGVYAYVNGEAALVAVMVRSSLATGTLKLTPRAWRDLCEAVEAGEFATLNASHPSVI